MGDIGHVTGRTQFALAAWLAAGALAGCWLLQAAMYVRPAPNGGPFLAEWERYFGLALYYELLGVWLLCLPFFLLWLILYRRPLRAKAWRIVSALQAALLTANLFFSQVDHEALRFLGVRLNPSFLYAYGQPRTLTDRLFIDVLAQDQGGPFLSVLLLLLVPGLYAWWALRRIRHAPVRAAPFWLALLIAFVPPVPPANGWRQANGLFRLRKVEPVVLALATDIHAGYADWKRPADFAALAAGHQRRWRARSADPNWRFPDAGRPYWRVPTGPAPPPEAPWNVIYLQLETFRGKEMGALNPGAGRSATPFLDGLATGPNAALWTRAASFGMPSINGLFASHCSIAPPSRRYITSYTDVRFHCLPERLRARGYRAEMFNGGDTDWDNSSPFIARWYDRLRRFPEARGRDRIIFREAAADIRRLGRSGRPFLATIVSVSNHWPFRTREPALDIAGQRTPAERIRNTSHYMDDVVREFVESIRGEPWFARTLLVIAGDHGYNAGEHGLPAGRQDLYRESVWVPLIVVGAHPRLAPGRHDTPASLLDIAPTLADLLGLREANPWQGHSLIAIRPGGELGFAVREAAMWESDQWSAVRDPLDGRARLYSVPSDWLQRRDLAARNPGLAECLLARADAAQRLNDYLLRHDLLW
ncbi:MAG TPA: sulfatase-like hydrolase/transferase [Allosphingosinicella sp.]|nr:sulfatase-like hydrolase/transferase [Allosphingosinicella sp.]